MKTFKGSTPHYYNKATPALTSMGTDKFQKWIINNFIYVRFSLVFLLAFMMINYDFNICKVIFILRKVKIQLIQTSKKISAVHRVDMNVKNCCLNARDKINITTRQLMVSKEIFAHCFEKWKLLWQECPKPNTFNRK